MNIHVHSAFMCCLALLSLLLGSCQQEDLSLNRDEDIQVTIVKDQPELLELRITMPSAKTYIYDFGLLGIEDGINTATAASHAARSEAYRTEDLRVEYAYQPEAEYRGEDFVQLERCISPGGGCSVDRVFKFHFRVE